MKNEKIEAYIQQYLKTFKPYKNGQWCYEDGIVLMGAQLLHKVTGDERYEKFIYLYLDKSVSDNGQLAGYKKEMHSIDNINAGKVLFDCYKKTGEERFFKALNLLNSQLKTHPRTESGSFWHKKRYPYQIWLDGLYMFAPFYARYIRDYGNGDYTDVIKQFENVENYLYDLDRNLYCHAYDEQKQMQWADTQTGQSPNIWSRSVGWYAMALVDVMEIIEDEVLIEKFKSYLIRLIDGLLPHQSHMGMWYQVVDQPSYLGNYEETSGTLMIAYVILKGVRLKYLSEDYKIHGIHAFEGTCKKYLLEKDNRLQLGGICEVAGLDHLNRDGSVDYYLSEPIAIDEAKGVAPLMMAYSEIYRLKI